MQGFCFCFYWKNVTRGCFVKNEIEWKLIKSRESWVSPITPTKKRWKDKTFGYSEPHESRSGKSNENTTLPGTPRRASEGISPTKNRKFLDSDGFFFESDFFWVGFFWIGTFILLRNILIRIGFFCRFWIWFFWICFDCFEILDNDPNGSASPGRSAAPGTPQNRRFSQANRSDSSYKDFIDNCIHVGCIDMSMSI